jgi:Ribonuclease G/E
MKQILINCGGLETRVAVTDNGKLQDYFIERHNQDHLVGSIYKGRICNLEASLQAAFVDIGQEKNAFLHYWDMIPASQDMLEEDNDERDEDEAALASHADDDEPAPAAESGRPVAGGAAAAVAGERPSFLDRIKRSLFTRNGGTPPPAASSPVSSGQASQQHHHRQGQARHQRPGGGAASPAAAAAPPPAAECQRG